MTAGSSVAVGAIVEIGWGDPASRHAIGADVARRMTEQLAAVQPSDSRLVVLGAGHTPFCSGWDVRDLAGLDTSSRENVAEYFRAGRQLLSALQECPVPVVAAVSGVALGFGCSLLVHADLVVADAEAQFGLPEITHGFAPATVMPELLEAMTAREVGAWALTGARHDAAQAQRAGLVHQIAPRGTFQEHLGALLEGLTRHDVSALHASKALLREQRNLPLPDRRLHGVAAAVDHFCR